mmetsp:Transcript_98796/g.195884  ORF Transcript_98796/g.195884 Transcript_98796/m.195884 type:complete len:237 (-) Transcript_98796:452-1162(-)
MATPIWISTIFITGRPSPVVATAGAASPVLFLFLPTLRTLLAGIPAAPFTTHASAAVPAITTAIAFLAPAVLSPPAKQSPLALPESTSAAAASKTWTSAVVTIPPHFVSVTSPASVISTLTTIPSVTCTWIAAAWSTEAITTIFSCNAAPRPRAADWSVICRPGPITSTTVRPAGTVAVLPPAWAAVAEARATAALVVTITTEPASSPRAAAAAAARWRPPPPASIASPSATAIDW